MGIESADGKRNAGGEAKLFCPGGAEAARHAIGREIGSGEFRADAGEERIDRDEEVFRRRPPSCGLYIHLWPMAQMLRGTSAALVKPQSVAVTMSQFSKAVTNCERLSGLFRSQWRSFENPHSEE